MTVDIREMTRGDIPTVSQMEAEIYDQPWSPRVFFDELGMDNREYLVITNGDSQIVGYGGLLVIDDDAHITTRAVAPEARLMWVRGT
jgi:ribosomal protein S18 acetylase RimI-like enzyme